MASTSEAIAASADGDVNMMMMMEAVSRATVASVASDRWFLDSTVHHVTQSLLLLHNIEIVVVVHSSKNFPNLNFPPNQKPPFSKNH